MVMAWLLQSVSQEITASIMFQDSARDMWHDLHERFNQGNGPRIFQLQTSVHSIKQGDSDVNTYFTRLKALWDELKEFQPIVPCSCGCTCGAVERLLGYYTRDQILQFLTGLNDSYNPIRAQILLYDLLSPLSKVFSMIVLEERQRCLGNPASLIAAAVVPNHSTKPPLSRSKKPRPSCSHCLKPGHLVQKKNFLHGFPPGYGAKRRQEEASKPTIHQVLASLVAAPISGKQPLFSQNELSQQLISLLSQQLLNSSPSGDTQPIASQISGNPVDFLWIVDSGATHHAPTQTSKIGIAKKIGKLFFFEQDSCWVQSVQSDFSIHSCTEMDQWHCRLGHPSLSITQSINKTLFVSDKAYDNMCSICHLAKQKCLPFISHNNMSSAPFDLVHLDIWGPFHVISIEGYKYFLTIVDDHSRFTWVYMLKAKSDVQVIIPQFFSLIATQFSATIKVVRCDNAKELNLTSFYVTRGIDQFHSCVDRPQQNSVVERKHQHILNMAWSLLFQSHLSLPYWSYLINMAVYLINTTPSLLLKKKTTFELLYNKLPSYDHLRCFGCLAYASTLDRSRHKFSPRSKACIFIGYLHGMKAYTLLDIESQQIFHSRDVIFYENIFPLKHDQSNVANDQLLLSKMFLAGSHSSPESQPSLQEI
ncbi:uncharacterized protein LOC133799439 [Humulus lupulus]|uniref:uncharacterized protein LOC133799439 n=1 Tax=Humulus lupulus TaxID=3486 RepID=UPI002B411F0F|nr:uncharacterized protein LOC133799439 [Humulus lupulus]